jgi:broad specificity phosphatase PhoE
VFRVALKEIQAEKVDRAVRSPTERPQQRAAAVASRRANTGKFEKGQAVFLHPREGEGLEGHILISRRPIIR